MTFGLTPQGGDVAGWPKLKMQGKAKVMSHQKPAWATDLNYQYEGFDRVIAETEQRLVPSDQGITVLTTASLEVERRPRALRSRGHTLRGPLLARCLCNRLNAVL